MCRGRGPGLGVLRNSRLFAFEASCRPWYEQYQYSKVPSTGTESTSIRGTAMSCSVMGTSGSRLIPAADCGVVTRENKSLSVALYEYTSRVEATLEHGPALVLVRRHKGGRQAGIEEERRGAGASPTLTRLCSPSKQQASRNAGPALASHGWAPTAATEQWFP